MILYKKIIGGSPSSTSGLANHVMIRTLPTTHFLAPEFAVRVEVMGGDKDVFRAAYNAETTGVMSDDVAWQIIHNWGEKTKDWSWDQISTAQTDIADKISRAEVMVLALREGAPLGHIREDLHPSVARGLGIGIGARNLSTAGHYLTTDIVANLMAGLRADGELIEGKFYASEKRHGVNPKTGEERVSKPIGAYDFVVTPNNTISILFAMSDQVLQEKIFRAHVLAANEAMGMIADQIGRVRTGKDHTGPIERGHVGWISFDHFASRRTAVEYSNEGVHFKNTSHIAGDPRIHTHYIIPNAVFLADGSVRALDAFNLDDARRVAGQFYHARMAQYLRMAGFEMERDLRTNTARAKAVPVEAEALFDKRRDVGEALARKYTSDRGEIWENLTDKQRQRRIDAGAHDQRTRRDAREDDIANFQEWRRQAREIINWSPDTLLSPQAMLQPVPEEVRRRQAADIAREILRPQFETNAVLPYANLRVAAASALIEVGVKDREDIQEIVRLLNREGVDVYGERTALTYGHEDGTRRVSVTTKLHEDQEREFVHLIKQAYETANPYSPAQIDRAIRNSGLDLSGAHGQAQEAAIRKAGEGRQFTFVTGAAGAGKTAIVAPVVSAARERGWNVIGSSLAWRQADDLRKAGIEQRDVYASSILVEKIRDGSVEVDKNTLVVFDEYGLLGTRQMLEFLRFQKEYGFSILAVGDGCQLSSIEAGDIVALTQRALGEEAIPVIASTKRQESERERRLVGLIRQGRAAEALGMLHEDGRTEAVDGAQRVVDRVAAVYIEAFNRTGEAPAVLAPTNAGAHQIAEGIRRARQAAGQVDASPLIRANATDGERQYRMDIARGDRIRIFRSLYGQDANGRTLQIGRNGHVVTVVGRDGDWLEVINQSGRLGAFNLKEVTDRNGRLKLAYGDVLTIHTAQGITSKNHILALPNGSKEVNGKAFYSAATRSIHQWYLVTNRTAEKRDVQGKRAINDPEPITDKDIWAQVASRMAYSPAKDTALALLDRISRLQRGTAVAKLAKDDTKLMQHASENVQIRAAEKTVEASKPAETVKLKVSGHALGL